MDFDFENAEQVKQQAAHSLGTVLEYVEQGASFAAEQAPLVVQEIVTWGIWSNGVFVLMWSTGFFCVSGIIFWCARTICEDEDFKADIEAVVRLRAMATTLVGAFAFVFGVIAYPAFSSFLKALLAPRLYVIEYIKDLI